MNVGDVGNAGAGAPNDDALAQLAEATAENGSLRKAAGKARISASNNRNWNGKRKVNETAMSYGGARITEMLELVGGSGAVNAHFISQRHYWGAPGEPLTDHQEAVMKRIYPDQFEILENSFKLRNPDFNDAAQQALFHQRLQAAVDEQPSPSPRKKPRKGARKALEEGLGNVLPQNLDRVTGQGIALAGVQFFNSVRDHLSGLSPNITDDQVKAATLYSMALVDDNYGLPMKDMAPVKYQA